MAALCVARLVIATTSFKRWRHTLGGSGTKRTLEPAAIEAARLANHINWAAKLLPFETKCLSRAMALSWLLRLRETDHCVVFAARPAEFRGANDQLHAWVEVDDKIILGDLPGPWFITLRLGRR